MPRWSSADSDGDDIVLPADTETEEPETIWSGPIGMTTRFGLLAAALFALYWMVQATSAPVETQADLRQPLPAERPSPASRPDPGESASLIEYPAVNRQPVAGDPLQEPHLPARLAIAPQKLCELIKSGDGANKWRPSEVHSSEWECMSSRSSKARSSAADASKPADYGLFSIARGTGKESVNNLRFKFSAMDQDGLDSASEAVVDRLQNLYGANEWSLPEKLVLSIKLQKPISFQESGIGYQVLKEKITDKSYNLIIVLPKSPDAAKAQAQP